MLCFTSGDLFLSHAQALVNPVNCVGVMGKGLALQFRERFPENYRQYRALCLAERLHVGQLFVCYENDKIVINFPTKIHWKNPSQLSYVEDGLKDLVAVIEQHKIHSVAVPPLGCGLGGLNWYDVRALLVQYLGPLEDVRFDIYEQR